MAMQIKVFVVVVVVVVVVVYIGKKIGHTAPGLIIVSEV